MAKRQGDSFEDGDWVTIIRPKPGDMAWVEPTMGNHVGQVRQIEGLCTTATGYYFVINRYCYTANRHFRHATQEEIDRATGVRPVSRGIMDEIYTDRRSVSSLTAEEVVQAIHELKGESISTYTPYDASMYFNPVPPTTEKKLKFIKTPSVNSIKLFKYIPISLDGKYGFYDDSRKLFIFPKITDGNYIIQKLEIISVNIPDEDIKHYYNPSSIEKLCKFRIKDYKNSGKLFRYSDQKAQLVGKILPVHTIEFDVKHGKEERIVNTLYVDSEFGNLRMLWEDMEILYPNIKGYKAKLNKALVNVNRGGEIISINVKEGEKLKIRNDKGCKNAQLNDIITIKKIKTVGNTVFIGFIGKFNTTKELDYVNIKQFKKLEFNAITKKNSVKEEIHPKITVSGSGSPGISWSERWIRERYTITTH